MMFREKEVTGRKTYDDTRELAEIDHRRDHLNDPLSYLGDGAGKAFTRAGCWLIGAVTIISMLGGILGPRLITNSVAAGNDPNAYTRLNLDAREESVRIAGRFQDLLIPMSDQHSYVRDPKSGRLKFSDSMVGVIKPIMEDLSSSWPGYGNSPEMKMISSLLTTGASSKDIYKMYDGLSRKYQKRVDREWINPIEDISSLKKAPPLPDLSSL